jgi:hypothetical protein
VVHSGRIARSSIMKFKEVDGRLTLATAPCRLNDPVTGSVCANSPLNCTCVFGPVPACGSDGGGGGECLGTGETCSDTILRVAAVWCAMVDFAAIQKLDQGVPC